MTIYRGRATLLLGPFKISRSVSSSILNSYFHILNNIIHIFSLTHILKNNKQQFSNYFTNHSLNFLLLFGPTSNRKWLLKKYDPPSQLFLRSQHSPINIWHKVYKSSNNILASLASAPIVQMILCVPNG